MSLTMELCGKCVAILTQKGGALKRLGRGVDNKITCECCHRRRYVYSEVT